MDDIAMQRDFLQTLIDDLGRFRKKLQDGIEHKKEGVDYISIEVENEDEAKEFNLTELNNRVEITDRITQVIGDENIIDNNGTKWYLICNGVEKCSKMIRIGDGFSSKALRNIKFGKHTYLLGEHETIRFFCGRGAIKGWYWNRQTKQAFEFGFDLVDDGYYFPPYYTEQFNRVAKLITFIELGDIEVEIIEKGRNNGKSKKNGKITNTSEFTVYVVDSSWNKLIIRTDGFAVMGHFRLQACGEGFKDRKLIWIDAFEKHGYKRQPKAKIVE